MAIFHDGEMVDVVFLGEQGRHRAQIVEGSVGTALLDLMAPLDMPPYAMVGHLDRGRGVPPVEGIMKPVGDGLRVRFLAGAISDTGHARRRHARISVLWKCELAMRNGRRWAGTIHDISTGGMLVASPQPLDLNTLITFAVERPGIDVPIRGHAKVLRQTPSGEYALHFVLLPPVAAEQLRRLIDDARAAAGAH